ncbi:hypothetical protein GCM10010448_65710 [Streptomyces glomeratus]|uniref:Uncharacterized protein n=1 Tax=Streptomyces glomeratus TaxID=284452 RepID=A0ABP6M6I6_9ACTN
MSLGAWQFGHAVGTTSDEELRDAVAGESGRDPGAERTGHPGARHRGVILVRHVFPSSPGRCRSRHSCFPHTSSKESDGFGRILRPCDGAGGHRHAGAAASRETKIVAVCIEQGASTASAPAGAIRVVSRSVSRVSEVEALSARAD